MSACTQSITRAGADSASYTEVEEPVETLEVSCWSEAYSRLCAGLRGVLWEGFFVCLGVCSEFYFQCLLKSMMVPVMSVRREIVQDVPLFTGSALSPKTAFSTMQEIILFGNFCRVMSSMYCGLVTLPF